MTIASRFANIRGLRIISVIVCVLAPVLALDWSAPRSTQAINDAYQILESRPLTRGDRMVGREIICACFTGKDRIRVIRRDGSDEISPNLDQESDFDGTLWLIDVGDRDFYQIVVVFHRDDDRLIADLYQDQDEDGKVATRGSLNPRITEPGTWSIRSVALDGYWQRDGRLAANLDIIVDDRMYAAFGAENYVETMVNDGSSDVTIRVRGPQGDDPRSYEWRDVHPPVPDTEGILRTLLMVREHGSEPPTVSVFPWLMLGYSFDTPPGALLSEPEDDGETESDLTPRDEIDPGYSGFDHPYGSNAPPFQVDWNLGRVAFIGEIISSRWSDTNWFTYSINRVLPDVTTAPNFESPFSYYDLAGDADGVPELQVRVERINAGDPTIANAAWEGRSVQKVRYSWDQVNDQQWTYKLGMLGQYDIEQKVEFPEFTLQTIPYNDFPTWVTERPWDFVTFIAADRPLWTSEGLYNWDPTGSIRDVYYAGLGSSLGGTFDFTSAGTRGEYNVNLADQPWLTFNPIDGQLHLYRAQAGVWNIDGDRIVKLSSSDQRFIDGWQLFENEVLAGQLYRVTGGLLYSDGLGTWYLPTEIPYESFRTLPPADTNQWTQLGQQLTEHDAEIEPGDLAAMFRQFSGSPIQLATGPMDDFQRLGDGTVQFVVDTPDPSSRNVLAIATAQQVDSEMSLVSFESGRWAVSPAFVAPAFATVHLSTAHAKSTVPITVQVSNPGSGSLERVFLTVSAQSGNGTASTLHTEAIPLIAGGATVSRDLSWVPRDSGNWQLTVTLSRATVDPRTLQTVMLVDRVVDVTVEPPRVLSVTSSSVLGSPVGELARVGAGILLALVGSFVALTAVSRDRGVA